MSQERLLSVLRAPHISEKQLTMLKNLTLLYLKLL